MKLRPAAAAGAARRPRGPTTPLVAAAIVLLLLSSTCVPHCEGGVAAGPVDATASPAPPARPDSPRTAAAAAPPPPPLLVPDEVDPQLDDEESGVQWVTAEELRRRMRAAAAHDDHRATGSVDDPTGPLSPERAAEMQRGDTRRYAQERKALEAEKERERLARRAALEEMRKAMGLGRGGGPGGGPPTTPRGDGTAGTGDAGAQQARKPRIVPSSRRVSGGAVGGTDTVDDDDDNDPAGLVVVVGGGGGEDSSASSASSASRDRSLQDDGATPTSTPGPLYPVNPEDLEIAVDAFGVPVTFRVVTPNRSEDSRPPVPLVAEAGCNAEEAAKCPALLSECLGFNAESRGAACDCFRASGRCYRGAGCIELLPKEQIDFCFRRFYCPMDDCEGAGAAAAGLGLAAALLSAAAAAYVAAG